MPDTTRYRARRPCVAKGEESLQVVGLAGYHQASVESTVAKEVLDTVYFTSVIPSMLRN